MAEMAKIMMMRSVRRNIHAIWVKGSLDRLPKGNYILAPNHHSWWDAYLLWFITRKLAVGKLDWDFRALVDDEQLSKFYFFRHLGAIAASEIRTALRFLKQDDDASHVLVIFPEGGIKAPSHLKGVEKGFDYFAQKTTVPVVPLAMRIVFRGAQLPEVFLNFGSPINFSPKLKEDYIISINNLLVELEDDISTLPPEEDAKEYLVWQTPRLRFDERMAQLLAFGRSSA